MGIENDEEWVVTGVGLRDEGEGGEGGGATGNQGVH